MRNAPGNCPSTDTVRYQGSDNRICPIITMKSLETDTWVDHDSMAHRLDPVFNLNKKILIEAAMSISATEAAPKDKYNAIHCTIDNSLELV